MLGRVLNLLNQKKEHSNVFHRSYRKVLTLLKMTDNHSLGLCNPLDRSLLHAMRHQDLNRQILKRPSVLDLLQPTTRDREVLYLIIGTAIKLRV